MKPSGPAADYVIVGAGSSGSVLARRLSENPCTSVILLEAGGDDRLRIGSGQFFTNLAIKVPAGFTQLLTNRRVTWDYTSEPDPGMDGRRQYYPRGKVLGGSSAINGMMYVRGMPFDYDGWRQAGCIGWGWDDVAPLFERIECRPPSAEAALRRGKAGMSIVSFPEKYPVIEAMLRACEQAGLPRLPSLNGAIDQAAAYNEQNTRRGLRDSAASAYLHRGGQRANLRVLSGAIASRILFDGTRATGIALADGRTVHALKEVILSCGAVNTPHLLELSGVGAAGRLGKLGIAVVADRAEVGENLQDHLTVKIEARTASPEFSFNRMSRGRLLAREVWRFASRRRGLLAQSIGTITGYLRTQSGNEPPQGQFTMAPATVDGEWSQALKRTVLEQEPGMTLGGYIMRPHSRGSIHAQAAEPSTPPAIRLNYLSAPEDQRSVVLFLRRLRGLLRQPALADIVVRELPLTHDIADGDDAGWLAYARQTGFTAYHPVGTCRMGDDAGSVTDASLRVRGVTRLRIADASIMPRIVSGNTNAACMMIGEKAAELLLRRE